MATKGYQFPRRRPLRYLMQRLIKVIFSVMTDFHISGQENIPLNNPLIVVANHFSFIDPVAVIRAIPRPLEFVGGFQMPNAPSLITWIPRLWGYFPVYRGSVSRGAMLASQEVIARDGALVIFPEAGSWATTLRPARPGAAFLATRTGAPILPIGLDGLVDVFPRLRKGRRSRVTVRIGKPFGPFTYSIKGREGRQKLEAIGNEIMRRIAELIPPKRHGFFSDDPEIRAAAEGTEIYPWAGAPEG